MKITEKTLLEELSLPYLKTLLEEVFLLPKEKEIKTVGELSSKTGLVLDETKRRLSELKKLSEKIQYTGEIPPQEPVFYLDVSLEAFQPSKLYKPLSHLSDPHFKDSLLALKAKNILTLVLSTSDERSFSAAMYLRQQSFKKVFMLEGPF